MTTVAIIDDHAMVRRGIQYILDMEDDFSFAGELESGRDAGAFAERVKADVILLDIRMPGADGLEALKSILAARPEQKVVMLTTSEADNDIYEAIRLGAKGYLMKDRDSDDLVAAIRAVVAGGTFFPPVVKRLYDERESTQNLTDREHETLDLMSKGLSNNEIAATMNVALDTVKTYIKGIYAKLGVDNRVSAVMEGFNRGFLRRPD